MVFKISLPLIENSFMCLSGPPDLPVFNWLIAKFICLLNVTGILFSLIGLSHKKNQAVSKPDLPNEDLCEDETTLYAILTY